MKSMTALIIVHYDSRIRIEWKHILVNFLLFSPQNYQFDTGNSKSVIRI